MNIEIKEDDFRIVIEKLNNEIKNLENIYNTINIKAKALDGTDEIWKGRTQEAVYSYYESIKEDFPDTVKKFKDYEEFLNKTLDNYINSDKSIDESINKNQEELTVN